MLLLFCWYHPTIRTNIKIPRSEEQGMKYQSLDFPEKISAWRTFES